VCVSSGCCRPGFERRFELLGQRRSAARPRRRHTCPAGTSARRGDSFPAGVRLDPLLEKLSGVAAARVRRPRRCSADRGAVALALDCDEGVKPRGVSSPTGLSIGMKHVGGGGPTQRCRRGLSENGHVCHGLSKRGTAQFCPDPLPAVFVCCSSSMSEIRALAAVRRSFPQGLSSLASSVSLSCGQDSLCSLSNRPPCCLLRLALAEQIDQAR